MKISAKDVIFGGLWGLISGTIVFVMAGFTAMAGGSFMPRTLKELLFTIPFFILLCPGYLSLGIIFILSIFFDRYIPFTTIPLFTLLPLISIVLGILLVNKLPSILAKLKVMGGR